MDLHNLDQNLTIMAAPPPATTVYEEEPSAYAKLVCRLPGGGEETLYVTRLPAEVTRQLSDAPEGALQLVLDDKKISKKHATIRGEGGNLVMEIHGKNGATVDGKRD